MRILQLTPGTGSFLCGSCLRDNTLVRALRHAGHDAIAAPLYLPFALEEGGTSEPVHMGGINVYLHGALPWTRFLPRFLSRALDSPRLLRFVAARSNMTDPAGLGKLTLSVLRGDEGGQRVDVERLISWIGSIERPEVILLSNAMLLGLARQLRESLRLPVVCTLQGEAPFLDALSSPYSEQCWDTITERARDVDAFIPVSNYTAQLMTERMQLDPERVHVVRNGIELDGFSPVSTDHRASLDDRRPTIGFLARMCADKGLPMLVESFLALRERGTVPGVRLLIGGVLLAADEPLVHELGQLIDAAGAASDVEFRPNLAREEKIELLRSLTVFSVPAEYGESFGLYLLEALACGVPVVQPRTAAFPELLEATGGGVLFDPGVPGLTDALEQLLLDPERARQLAHNGRAVVLEEYTAARMAQGVASVCAAAIG